MSQHQRGLLVLSFLSSFLYIFLTVVEGFSFFFKLGLEVKDLLISVGLDSVQFFLKTFNRFLLLFPFLSQISSSTLRISDGKFKLFIKEGLFLLKLGNFGCQFLAILFSALFLLIKPLVRFWFHHLHLLAESLLSVSVLVIEHLALILKSLLKASLGVIQLFFLLLILLLKECEFALPESLLFVQCSFRLLQLSLRVFKFAFQRFEVCSSTKSGFFVTLSQFFVLLFECYHLLLIRPHKLGIVFLKGLQLLWKDSDLFFWTRCLFSETCSNFLQFSTLGLILCFSSLFLLLQSTGPIFKLTLHFFFFNLDFFLISGNRSVILDFALLELLLCELELLLD